MKKVLLNGSYYYPRRCKIVHQSDCDPNKGTKPYFVTLWIASFCPEGGILGNWNEIHVGRIDKKRRAIYYTIELAKNRFNQFK